MPNSFIQIKNYINNIGSNGFTYKVYDNNNSFFIINSNLFNKFKIKEIEIFLKRSISFFEFLDYNKKESFFNNFFCFFEKKKNKILNMNKIKSLKSFLNSNYNLFFKENYLNFRLLNNYINSNNYIKKILNNYIKNIIINIFFNI